MDIIVPANGTYDFTRKTNTFFYGDFYKQMDNWVKIEIDGEEQYLMHSDYAEIISDYEVKVADEKLEYDKNGNLASMLRVLITCVGCILILISIHQFIKGYKEKMDS